MDVGERAEQLVDVQLDFENGHDSLHLVEVAWGTVNGLRDEFEHEIEIDFVLLWLKELAQHPSCTGCACFADTYPLAIVVKESFELNNVGMSDDAHDLQFTVLVQVSKDAFCVCGVTCAEPTLKRLSCKTRLMAASSPLGDSLVWKTTPKEPFPTILHCV
jgi:hypothetical protein